MFLVEAPLGAEYTLLQDDPSLRKSPSGFDSVVARGSVEPDPRGDATMTLDGKPVTVPQAKEIQTGRVPFYRILYPFRLFSPRLAAGVFALMYSTGRFLAA